MGAQNYSSSGSHLRNNETEPTPQILKEPAECSSELEIDTRFLLYLLLHITGIIKDEINVKQFNKLRFNRDKFYYDNLKTVKTMLNKQIKEDNINKVKQIKKKTRAYGQAI